MEWEDSGGFVNAGQRVDAVRRLATAMEDWPYSEIDLVLKQFGAPWSNTWSGNVRGYLVHCLGEANDQTLVDLEQYFGDGDAASSEATNLPSIWSGEFFRLFLSHSSVDKAFVSQLKNCLRWYGIEGFVAHEDIDPTAEWLQTILGALDSCDALAAFLTDDFRSSNWCDQEVGHCIGMRKLLIPLARGPMPWGFMGRYQALKCVDQEPSTLARCIADIVIAHPLTSARMAEALVANLERSESFADAKTNMALVRRVKVWTPDLLRKLEGSTKNSQVSGSWGVPESIRDIVAKNSSPAPLVFDDGIPF